MRKLLNTPSRTEIMPMDMLSKSILFCGDNHGHFEHIIAAVNAYARAAIVLLGDVQAQNPLEQELAEILDKTQVWFIPGNHDTDSDADHDNLWGSALAHRNLHGRVVEVAGMRIAGLGGIFREQIWSPPMAPAYNTEAEFCAGRGRTADGGTVSSENTEVPFSRQTMHGLLSSERTCLSRTSHQACIRTDLARSMSWPRHCMRTQHFMGITTTAWTIRATGNPWTTGFLALDFAALQPSTEQSSKSCSIF